MDTLSNTTFLKRMGILDIIAAIFLVIMGALLLNVEFNAEFGGSAAIIQALKFLIALGVGCDHLRLGGDSRLGSLHTLSMDQPCSLCVLRTLWTRPRHSLSCPASPFELDSHCRLV